MLRMSQTDYLKKTPTNIDSSKLQRKTHPSQFNELWKNLTSKSTAAYWSMRIKVFARYRRSKLKNKGFSIICNNCIAGLLYQKFGLPYLTPTVGLFFYSNDYIKFLENFEHYLKQPLEFIVVSKHQDKAILSRNRNYPIGKLDDVEIHFMHYKNPEEALEKWNRRKNRIDFQNLFFIYSDRDNFREEFLERYENLPFKNKIFFSSKPCRGKKDLVVFVKDYKQNSQVGESEHNGKYDKYINIVKWLNNESDFMKK